MSYHERRAVAMMVSTVLVFAAYCLVLYLKYRGGDFAQADPLRLGAVILLLLVPLLIVSKILTMILFTIGQAIAVLGNPEIPIEDERDKMIGQKSAVAAFSIFGAGFFLAMGTLALAWPMQTAFYLLFFCIFATDIGIQIAEFRFYRRGF